MATNVPSEEVLCKTSDVDLGKQGVEGVFELRARAFSLEGALFVGHLDGDASPRRNRENWNGIGGSWRCG